MIIILVIFGQNFVTNIYIYISHKFLAKMWIPTNKHSKPTVFKKNFLSHLNSILKILSEKSQLDFPIIINGNNNNLLLLLLLLLFYSHINI